jgi:hypothetical protein
MRKRARTDLGGGRSAMVVPTATTGPDTDREVGTTPVTYVGRSRPLVMRAHAGVGSLAIWKRFIEQGRPKNITNRHFAFIAKDAKAPQTMCQCTRP